MATNVDRVVQVLDRNSLRRGSKNDQKAYRELDIELNAELTDVLVVQHKTGSTRGKDT